MGKKISILPNEKIQAFLLEANWSLDKGQLFRDFSFTSYALAASFVQELASMAEEQNHHPDILLRWKKVSVWLFTHDDEGITQLDTTFALQANAHFSSLNDDN